MAKLTCRQSSLVAFFTIFYTFVAQIEAGTNYVTCGSLVKLLNIDYNVRLHSHNIQYGSGSGQQSVTGTEVKEDGNSYWIVKSTTGKECERGKPMKCGESIRLEHLATKKNLHSHHVSSPLSGKQEISAYGNKGEGDRGDHWIVECSSDYWERDDQVLFKHIDTDSYLSVSGRAYGSPINDQLEVVGEYSSSSGHTRWQTMEGLFIHPSDFKAHHHPHTEL